VADANLAQTGPAQEDEGQDPEGLDGRENAFVDAVASGHSLKDGATAAGIGYRTAKRWHKRPEIVAAIRLRVSENLAQARAVLASGASRAARSLVDMSDGARVADAPTVSAARAVVEAASRLVEVEEMERRLSELEARLSGNGEN
jgi:hypothetical protein